jgi:hypothetical protein
MGGLEETLRGLRRHFSPPTLVVIIIIDYEEEEQVEKKTTEAEAKVEQPIEVEQSRDFSSKSIEGRFFDMEPDSIDIPIAIPTKAQSKCTMKCKGKEHVEEGNSLTKIIWKQTLVEAKEI